MIAFITSNELKFKEAQHVLAEFDIDIAFVPFINKPEIRSDEEVEVVNKALDVLKEVVKEPFIVDDSGIHITALNGFPGTYSKWVYEKIGIEGVLKLMHDVQDRSARFVSAVGFCDPVNERKVVFEAHVDGYIAQEMRGVFKPKFPYETVFIPKGFQKTYAEDETLKKKTSHRKKAFYKLALWLKKEGY